MIPWIYHRLTPRDQAGDLLQEVHYNQVALGAAASLTFTVPSEKMLLMCMFNIFQEDALGNQNQAVLSIAGPSGPIVLNLIRDVQVNTPAPATSYIYSRNGSPFLMIGPDHVITVAGKFASAAQYLQWSFNGLLIPHGTFSV